MFCSQVPTAAPLNVGCVYVCVQCFQNGIGITLIEARGATIRDGKHKTFDLITPYRTFR